ncbi:MAG: dihydroxy-acid dehydratase [Alphaproteobacteria bacterium]|nr:dihydroxy-acid dehydratase [Alphaproteobacteria bacterium]MBU0796100.1 dihydroxy-acid dehydratase [Alphaproteobacteria bacterium]MBU0888471.1 dihydroxy-acid dehydratase [Alphaproteobacteria bacterium]MBU1813066.1 dihydroxy-acid dehydratase [Alphaproteobacteria bacterium]
MTGEKRGMSRGLTSYGDDGFSLFLRKAFIKAMGYTDDALNRPIIGIVNTFSGYNACHRNVPDLIEAVKRGVMLQGALPVDFPTISLHESFAHPTSMYLRNLMAIDTEEMIRAQPMDAVVLIGGCDKTVPAQLMGAASANTPTIQLVTGAMLTGSHRGERVGACTDCRRFWGRYRADEIDDQEIAEVNYQLVPTAGTCSVMGTASTMALVTEALGMMLPGGACPPAVSAARMRHAEETGAAAVRIAADRLTPDKIMTPKAFENALRVLLAIGGSTNGLVHLTAMAGRMGIEVDLESVDRLGADTPVLVDLKPSGSYYMEDLHKAGGLVMILRELKHLLNLDCLTVSGRTLGEEIEAAPAPWPQNVVRTAKDPIYAEGGIAVLRGNLCPGGAIIKQSAAAPKLMQHQGRAVVFADAADLAARIDSDDLDVTPDDILVLQNIGPKGHPGMPEAGYLPIPLKLARQGVKDMVRISDGRMSGTAAGTIVLHVTPESADGGPLALVQTGDRIRLDVAGRRLDMLVDDAELERRRATLPPRPKRPEDDRGYRKLLMDTILQADKGVDFDFLVPPATAKTPLAKD